MLPLSILPSNSSCVTLQSSNHDDSKPDYGFNFKQYCLGNTGDNLPFLGFAGLAVILLFLCAILAGLTLAICCLDITRLHVLSIAGDQKTRNHALVIARIKRHASWFLCSMIICSVASAESIPIIIELLFGTGWLPIVVSTIAIAIFAELLPQYLIPRRAMIWGYYCWPFIWGCMWLTCIVSWPLSYLLDTIFGQPTDRGIYTLTQLDVLIRFHERAEKHGGPLGPDASRVMRGALHLDSQTLRGKCQSDLGKIKPTLTDVERCEAARVGIVVPWSSVRYIDINEEVTKELVLRIKSWAYSRIPVVGDLEAGSHDSAGSCVGWNHQKVFGFLHIKHLVGLELPDTDFQSKKLLVKDLPLYPLPIVRDDMPLYDLLNVFQLGMARIALVIPTPTKDLLIPLGTSEKNLDALPRNVAPLWSASTGLNARNIIEMDALDAHIDWTTDFLDAAQNDMKPPHHRIHSVIGISCPKPIGIITHEDILNTLLQRTSLDEKDFFGRDCVIPPTSARKKGKVNSVLSINSIVRTKESIHSHPIKLQDTSKRPGIRREESDGSLRRRTISGTKNRESAETADIVLRHNLAGRDDGIGIIREHNIQGFDGANEHRAALKAGVCGDCSSYKEKTWEDSHVPSHGIELIHDCNHSFTGDAVHSKTLLTSPASPSTKHLATIDGESGCPAELRVIPGNSNWYNPAILSRSRRGLSLSEETSLDYEGKQAFKYDELTNVMEHPLRNISSGRSLGEPDGMSCLAKGSHGIDSPDPMAAVTWNKIADADGSVTETIAKALQMVSEAESPNYHISLGTRNVVTQLRKESFHDDRTQLPSQRKPRDRKAIA